MHKNPKTLEDQALQYIERVLTPPERQDLGGSEALCHALVEAAMHLPEKRIAAVFSSTLRRIREAIVPGYAERMQKEVLYTLAA